MVNKSSHEEMKQREGKKNWLNHIAYGFPWVAVFFLAGYILWLNIPVVSLSTRTCQGTDCSSGIVSVQNTKEDWADGEFVQQSETIHVKKQGLEFSLVNPPAAEKLSLVLEWKGEAADVVEVQLSANKDWTEHVLTAAPLTTQLKDGWERVSLQMELPEDAVTRKWFVKIKGSQGHEVRLIQVNVLSDPSLFSKLHSWWRNTHR